MRRTASILAAAAVGFGAAGLVAAHGSSNAPITAHTVATTSTTAAPTVTVVGTGEVLGTPDDATMSFGVQVNAATAGAAYSGEAAQAQRLLDALRSAGVNQSDIQTQWVSLYPDEPSGGFTASSSVSAVIHGLAHAGSVIDQAVRAAGDSIRLQGISLSIGDTSSLMANARAAAVRSAQAKAQQYAQAAGLKLGGLVSLSESGATPRPIMYGAVPTGAVAQPIQAGQQALEVSVTAVYALTQ